MLLIGSGLSMPVIAVQRSNNQGMHDLHIDPIWLLLWSTMFDRAITNESKKISLYVLAKWLSHSSFPLRANATESK